MSDPKLNGDRSTTPAAVRRSFALVLGSAGVDQTLRSMQHPCGHNYLSLCLMF